MRQRAGFVTSLKRELVVFLSTLSVLIIAAAAGDGSSCSDGPVINGLALMQATKQRVEASTAFSCHSMDDSNAINGLASRTAALEGQVQQLLSLVGALTDKVATLEGIIEDFVPKSISSSPSSTVSRTMTPSASPSYFCAFKDVVEDDTSPIIECEDGTTVSLLVDDDPFMQCKLRGSAIVSFVVDLLHDN